MAEKFNFNEGLLKLEKIVQTMESGSLGLEDSLKYFEQGIKLTKKCQSALNEVEQKIYKLTAQDGYKKEKLLDES